MLASVVKGIAGALLGFVSQLLLYFGIYQAGKSAQHSADVEAEKDAIQRERDAVIEGQGKPVGDSLKDGSF